MVVGIRERMATMRLIGFEPRRGVATSLASMVQRAITCWALQRARMAQIRRVDIDRSGTSWARRDFRPTGLPGKWEFRTQHDVPCISDAPFGKLAVEAAGAE